MESQEILREVFLAPVLRPVGSRHLFRMKAYILLASKSLQKDEIVRVQGKPGLRGEF